MWRTVRRATREGVEFGLCAGVVLMLAEIVAMVVQRRPVFYTLREIAGPLLQDISPSAVFLVGIAAHLVIGALLGVVYCLLNAALPDRSQTRWDRQAVIGLLFGAAVWALKIHVVARYAYPALLLDRRYQFVELVLNTFFYGFPLALFYASAERRLRPLLRAIQGSQ